MSALQGTGRMSSWNGWRCLASYRTWLGWAIVGLVFAACYKAGWIDGGLINQVGNLAASIIGVLP